VTEDAPQTGGMPRSPWNVGDIVKATLLAVLCIGISIVAVLGAGFVLRLAGIHVQDTRVAMNVTLTVAQNVAFLVGIWAFGLRKYGGGIERLGLRPFGASAGCSYAAFALLLSLGFSVVYSIVLEGAGRHVETTQVLPLFGGGLFGFAVTLTIASGIVPFAEEMFFRGFLFPGLARRFGFAVGAVLSAVLFGAAHLNVDSFLPLSFFGLVLALLYSVTGSIYPGIVMHSVNNSIALLFAFLVETGALQ
jgi:CAAX protease family protein